MCSDSVENRLQAFKFQKVEKHNHLMVGQICKKKYKIKAMEARRIGCHFIPKIS